MAEEETNTLFRQHESYIMDILHEMDPNISKKYFSNPAVRDKKQEHASEIVELFLELSRPGPFQESFDLALTHEVSGTDPETGLATKAFVEEFMERERKVLLAYEQYRDSFPSQIWNCCRRLCFATIAIDATKFNLMRDILVIHNHAERCHADMEGISLVLQKRRKGVGGSGLVYVSKSRQEREAESGQLHGTRKQAQLREFASFVKKVLPFLYGKVESPCGRSKMPSKLCTQAICCLLGISRNVLYNKSLSSGDDDVSSLIDDAGMRMRQHRHNGVRMSCPPVLSLTTFDCGCDMPCFAAADAWALVHEYEEFAQLSRELSPRHKENSFLLNRLYDPHFNTTLKICNKALAALYNVSEILIAEVRQAIHAMCADPSVYDRQLLKDGSKRYCYHDGHPINRYNESIRRKIENHLDVVLRADPAGAEGSAVCRVYSPEINTHEKLRDTLKQVLASDEEVVAELSSSTIQRMVNSYLKQRKYTAISFTQSDHNACPQCKSLQYSILQFTHEARLIQREIDFLLKANETPGSSSADETAQTTEARLHELKVAHETKTAQEYDCVVLLQNHTERDMRIRETVKLLCDHFRNSERHFRSLSDSSPKFKGWNWRTYCDRASITHQDDMTKVDLPHFVVTATADITRWRFDVNAHVNAVTNDAVVFSHEQGMGPKNASLICEEVLLEHILRCGGESIKIIISDNASVGKNWVTTIALPQYLVDQGLVDVAVIVFLENNHGKWLADMMFGQFQTRRRRTTLLSIDDLLSGFESIRKKSGKIHGFALNPLCSVDFEKVLQSLGYEVTPPKDFGFVKRNIHFAAACARGAKNRVPEELSDLFDKILPDDAGMVRISTEPPGDKRQCELRYEDRCFDVPAVRHSLLNDPNAFSSEPTVLPPSYCSPLDETTVPLVVPINPESNAKAVGAVSSRNMDKVGYNGFKFRGLRSCPELNQTSSKLVRRAWPKGMLNPPSENEPGGNLESTKCAPVNWIVRRPISHFCKSEMEWKARYPPRNMLNAEYGKAPRESAPWIPTATYHEPPFPLIERTSAHKAMTELAAEHTDLGKPPHLLQLLQAVFRATGEHDDAVDGWLQRPVTLPTRMAVQRYKSELDVYRAREKGHPKAVKVLRRVFREDRMIIDKVERTVREAGATGSAARKLKEETFKRLYVEAEKEPGALDRFKSLVSKDHERYARELKEFRAKQKQFDAAHGLEAILVSIDQENTPVS